MHTYHRPKRFYERWAKYLRNQLRLLRVSARVGFLYKHNAKVSGAQHGALRSGNNGEAMPEQMRSVSVRIRSRATNGLTDLLCASESRRAGENSPIRTLAPVHLVGFSFAVASSFSSSCSSNRNYKTGGILSVFISYGIDDSEIEKNRTSNNFSAHCAGDSPNRRSSIGSFTVIFQDIIRTPN